MQTKLARHHDFLPCGFDFQGVFYHFKTLVELDAESDLQDVPFWKLPKEEQATAKVMPQICQE